MSSKLDEASFTKHFRPLASLGILTCALLQIGCHSKPDYSQHIEIVLRQDARTTDNAQTVVTVVQRMRAIDLSKCPDEFKAAYVAHIHAWDRMQSVERQINAFNDRYNSTAGFVEGFLRGFVFDFSMAGEAASEARRIEEEHRRVSNEVETTFHRAEQIAIEHGASLSPSSQ